MMAKAVSSLLGNYGNDIIRLAMLGGFSSRYLHV